MSRKQLIIDKFEAYHKKRAELQQKAATVQKNEMLSDLAIRGEVASLEKEHSKVAQQLKQSLRDIVNEAKQEISKPSDKVLSGDYNLRLQNLLTVFSLGDRSMTDDDLSQAMQPFKDDSIALAGLKQALIKGGREPMELAGVIPVNTKERSLQILDRIDSSLDDRLSLKLMIGPNDIVGGMFENSEVLGYEFALGALDDDLRYIHIARPDRTLSDTEAQDYAQALRG